MTNSKDGWGCRETSWLAAGIIGVVAAIILGVSADWAWLLAILGGAVVAGASFGLKALGAKLFLDRYGKTIETVFTVLDPLVGDLLNGYDESVFQEAVKLAVTRVADGEISDSDVLEMTEFVLKNFNPAIASSKKLDPTTPEGQATIELSNALKAFTDGVTFEELLVAARKATALV